MAHPRYARAARPRRRDARGQAVPFVAIAGVALMAITGLALDGGYEVGKYRQAQDGADAGALSAARLVYSSNDTDTSSQVCSATTAYGAQYEMQKHNAAGTTTCTTRSLTTYGPTGADGFSSYGALSTVDTDQNVTVLLNVDDLKSHIGFNETNASIVSSPASSVSGSVDLASLSASLSSLGLPLASGSSNLFTCSSSATLGHSQTAPLNGSTCPQSNLSLSLLSGAVNVNAALSLSVSPNPGLIVQSTGSNDPAAGYPQGRDSSEVVSATKSLTGATINANVGHTQSTVGTLPSAGGAGLTTGARSDVSLADVSATVGGIAISLSSVNVSAQASYTPGTGFTATATCNLASTLGATKGTGHIQVNGTITVSLGSDCSYTPISIPGVLSIGPSLTGSCSALGGGVEYCTESVCLMSISVLSGLSPLLSETVCIGKATASARFIALSSQSTGILVTDETDSPAFFMHILGWQKTRPTATAAAVPQSVTDVSSTAFTAAPYAVDYLATQQSGGASWCSSGTYAPLVPGCNYAVYGSNVDDNLAADQQLNNKGLTCNGNGRCWHGQLDPASAHAVGSQVSFISQSGSGPQPAVTGDRYVLLPVVDYQTGTVRFYGLFQATSTAGVYTMTQTPATLGSAPLAQSESIADWVPNAEGAAAIKLVDPSHLTSTYGWS